MYRYNKIGNWIYAYISSERSHIQHHFHYLLATAGPPNVAGPGKTFPPLDGTVLAYMWMWSVTYVLRWDITPRPCLQEITKVRVSTKIPSASGPLNHQGLCPWTSAEGSDPDPHCRLALPRAHHILGSKSTLFSGAATVRRHYTDTAMSNNCNSVTKKFK